jgi:hypothetical protein
MRDFTLHTLQLLLSTLKEQQYTFLTFADFIRNQAPKSIILRHDVDARKMSSLNCARLEKELGITGSYYFRMMPKSFQTNVIKEISDLGHEIGYHYEELCNVHGNYDLAIKLFEENLEKLRQIVPIETICMHGTPLSKYDNRLLWEKYNYHDFGIIGEPYFDINFKDVLYLTDTGRRWDGESVSIRDKAQGKEGRRDFETKRRRDKEQNDKGMKGRRDVETQRLIDEERRTLNLEPGTWNKTNPEPEDRNAERETRNAKLLLHTTFDIIRAIEKGKLPDKIMLTIHPQRWDGRPFPWIRELIWQNVKNVGKWIVTNRQKL